MSYAVFYNNSQIMDGKRPFLPSKLEGERMKIPIPYTVVDPS